MFGIGGWELAILALFGFLIFGPDKMPQIARTIGRAMRQFRNAQEQMNKVIKAEVYDPLKDVEPLANPFAGLSLDDTKKDTDKKSDSKTDKSKNVAKAKKDDSTSIDTEVETEEKPKITGDAMQAAIAAEAEKSREKAVNKATAKTATETAASESFAQRRARLEKEHAQAKASKDSAVTETSLETGEEGEKGL